MPELTSDLSKHCVLAIDDEIDNLEVLRTTLEVMHNATVYAALSCQDALELLETCRPTLVISDISMPHMDGFELLKALRGRLDTKDLPIIALTALAMPGDRERILSAGFDGYIEKPFEVLTLGPALKRQLDQFIARHQPTGYTAKPVHEPPLPLVLPEL